jgi:hypothetical protein
MHTLLDLQGNIPTFISITNGGVHDVNILDEIVLEAGAFYVMDRGYVDFERLYGFTGDPAVFYDRVVSDRRGLPYSEGVVTLSSSRYCLGKVANLPPAPAPSKCAILSRGLLPKWAPSR